MFSEIIRDAIIWHIMNLKIIFKNSNYYFLVYFSILIEEVHFYFYTKEHRMKLKEKCETFLHPLLRENHLTVIDVDVLSSIYIYFIYIFIYIIKIMICFWWTLLHNYFIQLTLLIFNVISNDHVVWYPIDTISLTLSVAAYLCCFQYFTLTNNIFLQKYSFSFLNGLLI